MIDDQCRLVVAGSRDIIDQQVVCDAINESGYWGMITEIVSGGAKGVDAIGEMLAAANSIPLIVFLPEWKKYGRSAGPIRNEPMAHYCDAAVLIRKDGVASKGTTSMMKAMLALNKPVHLKEV